MGRAILLVEDNASDEKLTVLALKKANLSNDIVVARDGAEALDFLLGSGKYAGRDTTEPPALVLLDLKLPRIDGLDVLRAIRGNDSTRLLPVVILTSSTEDEDVVRSYSLGANAYVRKPVDFTEFVDAAKTLGLFWLLINRPPPAGRSVPSV